MANRLIHESSPYLLQHAHNPVDWFPWAEEAFRKAKEEQKIILVSIGYSACHWCHVMERESFEDATVAAYMNQHFVCIKVDREERPDVDAVYMDAIQALTGSGGWPLNVFLTPDRQAFYGGTYFPPKPAYSRASWRQILERVQQTWEQAAEDIHSQSRQILNLLQQANIGLGNTTETITAAAFDQMEVQILKQADKVWGGFGNAPKFPNSMTISFLLEHYHYTESKGALDQSLLSLDKMIAGGIHDHLGGGFCRYSTDRQWLAPHFEKMLYDNALMVLSLCDAIRYSGESRYRQVVQKTIAFVEQELQAPDGGFYCALDADSEGVEGKYYTWTYDQWLEATNGGNAFMEAYFGISKDGNWEGTNILHCPKNVSELCTDFSLSESQGQEIIAQTSQQLLAARMNRIRPQTDEKMILSWNALMNIALCRAAVCLSDAAMLSRAKEHLCWMRRSFFCSTGTVGRVYKDGQVRIAATLEDWGLFLRAMIDLASASGELDLIVDAAQYLNKVLADFALEGHTFLAFTDKTQSELPLRKVEIYDGAIPASNSVMASVLLQLGLLMERSDWYAKGEEFFHRMLSEAKAYPTSFSNWAVGQQRLLKRPKTVLVMGELAAGSNQEWRKLFPPHCLVIPIKQPNSKIPLTMGKKCERDSLIFVCTSTECLVPVFNIADALKLV
ncbi:MAG: thioredoxin domain-containing protein [Bacteroidetes bacterium]|nr:thioredoxin domain-containing protein [Bacteroidota bacterium]